MAVVEIDPSEFLLSVGSIASQAPDVPLIRVGSMVVVVASEPSGSAWVSESEVVSELIETALPVEMACFSAA